MERKDFLKTIGRAGVAAALAAPCGCFAAVAGETASPAKGTSCEKKQAWAQIWTKRFFDVLDAQLDEPTRTKLMEANGRACYRGSIEGQKITPVPVDDFVGELQKYLGKENARREGNVVYFNYVQNPEGLKVADGYCLCPLVESGPPGLSGTFCSCSVGYVGEMFELNLGKPVKVELLESLKRGGKGCRFKVTLT